MNLYRLQSCAGTCTLDSIKCQQQDNYWNAFSDFTDLSFNWDLSFTSHMVHWAQWIKFGNKTVFIIFISCCSLLKGRKKIQLSYFMAAVLLVDLSSINHLLRCCEVLTMHQQGIPGFHLNFFANTGAFPSVPSCILWYYRLPTCQLFAFITTQIYFHRQNMQDL